VRDAACPVSTRGGWGRLRLPLSRVPVQLPAPRGSRAPVTGGRGGRRTRLRCWRSYCSAWISTDFWSSPSASRGPCRARARTGARYTMACNIQVDARYTMACNIQEGAGARAARLISSQRLLRALLDEACPVSTRGGTRLVQLVREGGAHLISGASQPLPPPPPFCCYYPWPYCTLISGASQGRSGRACLPESRACATCRPAGTRLVRLVQGEGRGLSA